MKVLFVCMGNICRSPTAEGVFRKLTEDMSPELQLHIDSAGTHAYHVGEPPDHRAQTAARARGIDLSSIRARKVTSQDFELFDFVLAMDRLNYEHLATLCPDDYRDRLHLFLSFAEDIALDDVPDPYYGGPNGFEQVLDLVEAASLELLNEIRRGL